MSFGSLAVLLTLASAQAATLSLTDEILMVGDGTVAPLGPTGTGPLGTNPTGQPSNAANWRYVARERANEAQANRRVATFLQFDTSTITVADANDPNFEASFTIDHVGHLNNVNAGLDLVLGQVVSGAWDDSGAMNPLYNWAEISSNQTLLLENLQNHPNSVAISIDITSIVQDWVVNGSNQGLALFGDQFGAPGGNMSNASYLDNAALNWEIVPVPEPTSGMLSLLGAGLLLVRRRR